MTYIDQPSIRHLRCEEAEEKIARMIRVYKGQASQGFNEQIFEACPMDLSDSIVRALGESGASAEQQRIFAIILANQILTSLDITYDGIYHKKYLEAKNATELR